MDLSSKLLDVILKDLPNQTSGPLREYMNQAEANKVALERANKEIENLIFKAKQQEEKEKELREEIGRFNKLEDEFRKGIQSNLIKQLELQERELKLDLTLTKSELANEVRITTQQEKFLTLLVKNPVSMEYFYENKYSPGGSTHNKDGTITYHDSGGITEERRQRIEKTKEE